MRHSKLALDGNTVQVFTMDGIDGGSAVSADLSDAQEISSHISFVLRTVKQPEQSFPVLHSNLEGALVWFYNTWLGDLLQHNYKEYMNLQNEEYFDFIEQGYYLFVARRGSQTYLFQSNFDDLLSLEKNASMKAEVNKPGKISKGKVEGVWYVVDYDDLQRAWEDFANTIDYIQNSTNSA